jgi:hypothetical protein
MPQLLSSFEVSASSSAVELADWLEIMALLDDDMSASAADLIATLRQDGSIDAVDEDAIVEGRDDERMEQLAENALGEIDARGLEAGETYPFEAAGTNLVRVVGEVDRSVYVFLLLLSVYGHQFVRKADDYNGPREALHLFEDVAGAAARGYLGGSATGAQVAAIGFPRRPPMPTGFREALVQVMEKGIGSCAVHAPEDAPEFPRQNDGQVDLIAWRPFADRNHGRIIALGQCSTGDKKHGDMKLKAGALKPDSFQKLWMRRDPAGPVLSMYLCPHRILSDHWREVALAAGGLVFERSRITHLALELDEGVLDRLERWVAAAMLRLREEVAG